MRPEPKNLVKLINLRTETFTIKMSPLSPVIHAISVKNFKSLKETGMLRLKPITLLVGPNSSGKTALLQTILVLKQTLESRNIKTPLVLRGKYVDLGSFKETVFGYNS
jgi:AAA15 family ATPase/GTPase